MIYIDTSVVLAQLLAEDRCPPDSLWREPLVSSRLLEYEVWTRIHALRLTHSHAEPARLLLGRVAFVELSRPVLARALEPFPVAPKLIQREEVEVPIEVLDTEYVSAQTKPAAVGGRHLAIISVHA